MMQQTRFSEATWPLNNMEFSFDGVELYGLAMYNDVRSLNFLPSFLSTPENSSSSQISSPNQYFSSGISSPTQYFSSGISSPTQYFSSGLSYDSHGYHEFGKYLPNLDESSFNSKEKGILDEISSISDLMEIEENPFPSREILGNMKDSVEIPSAQLSLNFPQENIELDTQLSISNLIKAYGEATENGDVDLVEAIIARFEEKADPTGETFQRLVYYLVQSLDKNHMDYLRQEAFKILKPAFLALYQIFPFGKFAHYLAISEILNSLPQDAEKICIVDFDIGEGLQWPSLIESLGRRKYPSSVRLISIRWEENNYNSSPCLWKFEETKRQLLEHARSFNLKMEIEEMEMEGLEKEMETMKKSDFLAFNGMVNLPHMGRSRSPRQLTEFLKIAKYSITKLGSTNRGIITFGDGLMEERKKDNNGFGSFLEGQMVHFHALLESMDSQFPLGLIEARIAIECLFIAPFLSSLACLQRWEENSLEGKSFLAIGLQARRLSKDGVAEAKELVQKREEYWVRNEVENGNEMVLGYMRTPLVRVSSWK